MDNLQHTGGESLSDDQLSDMLGDFDENGELEALVDTDADDTDENTELNADDDSEAESEAEKADDDEDYVEWGEGEDSQRMKLSELIAKAENPEIDNPAARNYTQFSDSLQGNAVIWDNRQKLEFAMRFAATSLGREILPLPQEWWDFREKEDVWGQFAPLRENDLHPFQRLIDVDVEGIQRILSGQYPEEIKAVLDAVEQLVMNPSCVISPEYKPVV